MPAYLIIYYNVTNSEQFKKYLEAVGPLMHKKGGRMIVEGLPDVVDGPFVNLQGGTLHRHGGLRLNGARFPHRRRWCRSRGRGRGT